MQQGTRIKHNFLGKGVVLETIGKDPVLIYVKFDKTPPYQYNGRQNPCCVLFEDCKKINQ
jgi:hypothetical protein